MQEINANKENPKINREQGEGMKEGMKESLKENLIALWAHQQGVRRERVETIHTPT